MRSTCAAGVLAVVVTLLVLSPDLHARAQRGKPHNRTYPGAFMNSNPQPVRLFVQQEPGYAEILGRTVLPSVRGPRELALDLAHHTAQLHQRCAATAMAGCAAAQAAETGQPRAWAEQLELAARQSTVGTQRAAWVRVAVAVRVELGDLAVARDLASDNAAQARGRDRLAALWQLQAVLDRMGDRPGWLRALQDLTRGAAGKASAVDWACATEALAEALETAGDAQAADDTWRKLLKRFEQMRLPKDGGPAARAAAHAQYALLLLGHEALRNAPWPDVSSGTPTEKALRLQRTVRTWMNDVFGPVRRSKNEVWRSGGRHWQWLGLARFGAKEWAYQGFFRSAELLVFFVLKVSDAPYIDPMTDCEEYDGLAILLKPLEDRALRILLAVHEDADRLGLSLPVVRDVRRMLNSYKPTEFPLLKDIPVETRDAPPVSVPTP